MVRIYLSCVLKQGMQENYICVTCWILWNRLPGGIIKLCTCSGTTPGRQSIPFSVLSLEKSHISHLKNSSHCGDDADRWEKSTRTGLSYSCYLLRIRDYQKNLWLCLFIHTHTTICFFFPHNSEFPIVTSNDYLYVLSNKRE